MLFRNLVLFYFVFLTLPLLVMVGCGSFGPPKLYERRHELLTLVRLRLEHARARLASKTRPTA